MISYLVAPTAESDLLDIGAFIERHNPAAAQRLIADSYDCFERLAEHPNLGHRRPDLTSLPVRFWAVRRRDLIVYRDDREPIEIVRVLNGYRDIASLLG